MFRLFTHLCITIWIICRHKSTADKTYCGDWEAFKDEKCFKIIDDTLVNYTVAIETCEHQDNSGSQLAIIESKEEQDFLTNFIFNVKQVSDNVWIGVQNTSTKFTSVDNSELSYTNWSPGSPQNDSGYNCVQMIADNALLGKWINEPCSRKNALVCQKKQTWSTEQLQNTLLEERKLTRLMYDTITSLTEEISHIKQNPLPPGFIYVQLPGQSEPKQVWPQLNWLDVSVTYAGLFFRVLGGSSEAFETEQQENDKHLDAVNLVNVVQDDWTNPFNIPLNGEWSPKLFSGDYQANVGNHMVHVFKLSTGEIRPRNKAVKIWKRVD